MTKLPARPSASQGDGDDDQNTGFAATTEKPQTKAATAIQGGSY